MNAPVPPNDTRQIIIHLTDGLNTQNRWTSRGSRVDRRTREVCKNIKAADIQIYTVLVMEGNAALLRECASDPAMFFEIRSANQLLSVFETIGSQIANLRLSR